jgi:zinc/manganese transport system substrate-binding protein
MKKLLLAVLLATPALAGAAPRVVTTTEGLAALAREVGGGASVESLSRGIQDPHFVDANPILAVKLRRADLLVDVGLDLESGWLPPLVLQSRNRALLPGGRGRLTAASAVEVLEAATGPVDRSAGDLHPGGNPHFLTDPRRAAQVAAAIAERLAVLDPGGAAGYRERAVAFQARMEGALARWQAALAPAKGKKILTHHRTLSYFLAWSGIGSAGEVEPKPGVPPSPAHLAEVVTRARREHVAAVVVENYYPTRSAETVARLAPAKLVQIPGDVGGEPEVKTYEQYVDVLVARIGGALR